MHTIYLVRHGQTEWNSTGFYQGFTNVPLNTVGLLQAQAVAQELATVYFDSIIASDLDRARITAETILGTRNIPFHTDERLREINFGDWEGLTYDQIEAKWPQSIYTMYRSPDTVKISNGESFQDVQIRAWDALQEEMKQVGEDKTILIVAHGGTNRTLICKMLNLPLHFAWNFSQGNTSISRIEFYGLTEDDHNTLSLLNYTKHLETLELS